MTKDKFVFQRSFFDAINLMAPDVQAEIYPAVVRYALDGECPATLSNVAMGVFLLIKSSIDTTLLRSERGKRTGQLGGRPKKSEAKRKTPKPVAAPALTLQQEVALMKTDRIWNEPVCMKFHISADEIATRLDEFLVHCQSECDSKPHGNIADAKRHFCSWMRKAHPEHKRKAEPAGQDAPPPSYEYQGGFGGQDV